MFYSKNEKALEGAMGIVLPLDGSVRADLKWDGVREIAAHYVSQGLSILWDIDLGTFADSEFLTVQIAIDHFRDTLAKEFATLGVNLYRGLPSHELIPTLDLLLARLPVELQGFVTLDLSSIESKAEALFLASPDHYPRFTGIVKGASPSASQWVWEGDSIFLPQVGNHPLGVLVPSNRDQLPAFEAFLQKEKRPYRLFSETHLSSYWEGVEELMVLSSGVSARGRRLLHGFEASGGIVKYVV